jgi:hypothetical protein
MVPFKRLWYRWIGSKIGSRWWWKRKLQTVINLRAWIIDQWRLLTHLRLLKSGKAIAWLMVLSREAERKNTSRWAPERWDDLVAKRGRLITEATKTGCKRAWRTFWPPLPHEESEPNKTDPRIIIGLTGLQAAFSDQELDFSQLDSRDATRAARYGVNELNGFASWFPTLAEARPQETEQVIETCIQGEWAFPAERAQVNEVLYKLAWQGKDLTFLAENQVWRLLRAQDPSNIKVLEYTLTILLRSKVDRAQIALLAEARAVTGAYDRSRCALWLAALLLIDASLAVTALERLLSENRVPEDIMIQLCSLISGDHFTSTLTVESPSYQQPQNLRRLIPLVYRYIRPSEDIDRTGSGGYTPTARDHAQEFRGRLLELLSRQDDERVPGLLSELMNEPELQYLCDWILRLIEEWQKRNADGAPWTAADIRAFACENEIDPKTAGDLFAIACKRINEIKLDVEKAENSLRRELHRYYPESELRKWLQRKLQERSRGRYTVPQEAEIDLQQRPDLRLENPRTPAVSVEVKWAEHWSVTQLATGLETQLADQYLRAHNATYGIYLLGMIGDKQYWENPSDRSHLSFQQLVDFLCEEATKLVTARPDIEDIRVVGIDFRTPQ